MRFANLSLKTKLLVMMLALLALSVSSLFFLHLLGEQRLLSQVREYTEDLSTAIEVVQEQPAGEGDPQAALKAYAEKLRQLGVQEVSIADISEEVQASTDPEKVGKRLERAASRKGPRSSWCAACWARDGAKAMNPAVLCGRKLWSSKRGILHWPALGDGKTRHLLPRVLGQPRS